MVAYFVRPPYLLNRLCADMAHFRGTIQGNRGQASRLGDMQSGLVMHCNGWNSGIKIRAYFDKETNQDCFFVWSTGGSKASTSNRLLGVFSLDADGEHLFELGGIPFPGRVEA